MLVEVKYEYETKAEPKEIVSTTFNNGKETKEKPITLNNLTTSWKGKVLVEVDNSTTAKALTKKFTTWFTKKYPEAMNLIIKSFKRLIEPVRL